MPLLFVGHGLTVLQITGPKKLQLFYFRSTGPVQTGTGPKTENEKFLDHVPDCSHPVQSGPGLNYTPTLINESYVELC